MMILYVEVPDDLNNLALIWEPGFKISTKVTKSPEGGETIIMSLNKEGLLSLARYLLILIDPRNKVGQHYHFDELNSKEKGSVELVIEKTG